ncbi:cell wall hydrolase [Orenia marismortui]|uniref:N-acetylmuramoyl-L-alanine amidase n=1 Tax=Orenia marismortui TaxID=46469 RepID=A0A4R8GWJ6_9FIRM|nr:cell wall hydrolase [Orenia marismortui]TDX46613.1 N-acetylmuramoyl-L-alanine amidase [Orenia marismortui]
MIKSKFILFICLMSVFIIVQVSFATPIFQIQLIYTVEQGDALINLAHKFDVTIDQIREANNLKENEFIKVGDKLIIPQNYEIPEQTQDKFSFYTKRDELSEYKLDLNQEYKVKIEKKKNKKRFDLSGLKTLNYYIKRGDNLYDLAKEFNTSISVLKELNDLDNNMIRLGDQIKLPINNLTPKEVLYHTISNREFELLARLIYGEARGEPYVGQVAVGAVILNRVIGSYFPNNITDVIYQPRQFSPVANGQINLRPNRTAYQAARAALRGEDPTRGAQYFYNPRTAKHQWWFKTRKVLVQIGNHVFMQ